MFAHISDFFDTQKNPVGIADRIGEAVKKQFVGADAYIRPRVVEGIPAPGGKGLAAWD